MQRRILNEKVGIDRQSFQRAATELLERAYCSVEQMDDCLLIVDRFLCFYDLDLLGFLGKEDIDRFLEFEMRVTPLERLPFRTEYRDMGRWVLNLFAQMIKSGDYVMVRDMDAIPWPANIYFKPLGDTQISALFEVLPEGRDPDLLLIFCVATGVTYDRVGHIKLDDLDLYNGVVTSRMRGRSPIRVGLGPLLRIRLEDYLKKSAFDPFFVHPLFPPPDRYEDNPNWVSKAIREGLRRIGIDEPGLGGAGILLATFEDQFAKAGACLCGADRYFTQLTLRHQRSSEEGRGRFFRSSVHPLLRGYISSLRNFNDPSALEGPRPERGGDMV